MMKETPLTEKTLDEIISQSEKSDAPTIYANHATFSIGYDDITINLYLISTNPISRQPDVTHQLRLVIPVGLGKGFTTAMANLIDGFEKTTKTILPIHRDKVPEESITIWE